MLTHTADALPQSKRNMRGRRLVIVDIENFLGGGRLMARDVALVRQRMEGLGLIGPGDQVVVGSSWANVLEAGIGWGAPARLVARSGLDGADLVLLDVLQDEEIGRRFGHVTVASGDGIFTDTVAWLATQGVEVAVVARGDACSKRLRLAASSTVLLNNLETLPLEAA